MKFLIYFLHTAHLLTEISAWLMTTPMQSEIRSKMKHDATSQIKKVVEMINLINSAYTRKDNGRYIDHSSRYGRLNSKHVSRRFDLPELVVNKRPPSLVPKQDDMETQLKKMAETVRYQVIDNPEVLEEYGNKQKKNIERYLMHKKKSSVVIDNQSLEAKYFNTDVKLKSYHKNAALNDGSHNSTNKLNKSDTFIQTSHHPTNPNFELDGDLELTNIEPTYQPTFADDDKENDIKLLKTTEKENNKPRTDEKNHALSAKIYNTNKFEKRTGIKARGVKHKVSVHEDNAHTGNLNDTELNKLDLQPLHNASENNNGQVTKNEENKEFDYNSNVRMRADNLNPKNNDYSVKNEGEKERKDIQPQQISKIKNKIKHTTPVHITSRKLKKKSNQEREEGHLIHDQQDRNENNNRHHEKKYEKIDNYDKEVKYKKINDKGSREKEIDLNNSGNQRYRDGNDEMEYEWNKRHLQYDKNDNSNNDNQRDSNDDEWSKKHYDSVNKENSWNKRDKKFNKRKRNSNKKGRRILWNRKLNMRESMDSDVEKEDALYFKK